MRHPMILVLALLLSCGLLSTFAAAQDAGLPAKLHPWGQFEPGTRKVVQVTTETLDEKGRVVGMSMTDTMTTLLAIDHESVTLEIDACVEVVGKRFENEPQTVRQGFHGEPITPNMKVFEPSDAQVSVDDQNIPCKVQRIESSTPNGKSVTNLYYSTTIAPYVFKRETVVSDADGNRLSETVMTVTSLEMPWKVLGESKNVFNVRTVQKSAKGTVTTLGMISPEIPGGLVSHSSKEVDKDGRMVRRNTLELTDYSTDPDQDRIFRSKRANRHRSKTTTRYGQ